MEDTITKDRDKYVGGSDIATLLGLNKNKSRYMLVLEKAGIVTDDFAGNIYTSYGQLMEGKIREHIGAGYVPACKIKDNLRANTDGFNGVSILEIKTTSKIYKRLDSYKAYLVQLLFYMDIYEVEKGQLAVYERPTDFDTDFNVERLRVYDIELKDYTEVVDVIRREVAKFWHDVERAKDNIFITEEEIGKGYYEHNNFKR